MEEIRTLAAGYKQELVVESRPLRVLPHIPIHLGRRSIVEAGGHTSAAEEGDTSWASCACR